MQTNQRFALAGGASQPRLDTKWWNTRVLSSQLPEQSVHSKTAIDGHDSTCSRRRKAKDFEDESGHLWKGE